MQFLPNSDMPPVHIAQAMQTVIAYFDQRGIKNWRVYGVGPVTPGEHTAAARDVLAERRRQQEVEGWTPEHDDPYKNGELARAAACYAVCSVHGHFKSNAPSGWPWAKKWWKPTDPRRDLVKAAALILAEIERLDRLASLEVIGKGEKG